MSTYIWDLVALALPDEEPPCCSPGDSRLQGQESSRAGKKKSHLDVDSHSDHSLPLPTWQQQQEQQQPLYPEHHYNTHDHLKYYHNQRPMIGL